MGKAFVWCDTADCFANKLCQLEGASVFHQQFLTKLAAKINLIFHLNYEPLTVWKILNAIKCALTERERISTYDLIELTSSNKLLFKLKLYFFCFTNQPI